MAAVSLPRRPLERMLTIYAIGSRGDLVEHLGDHPGTLVS
jgi:hypothetical protein